MRSKRCKKHDRHAVRFPDGHWNCIVCEDEGNAAVPYDPMRQRIKMVRKMRADLNRLAPGIPIRTFNEEATVPLDFMALLIEAALREKNRQEWEAAGLCTCNKGAQK